MARKQWTVMVFMGANNLPNEKDLSAEARSDLREMQRVGSGRSLNIVVHLDRKNRGPVRQYIRQGGRQSFPVPAGEGSTGNGEVLRDFLLWAQRHYPARHYLLVLWGHAYRLAFGRDGKDAMEFPKLASVLQEFKKTNRHGKAGRPRNLDLVGFDACGMSIVEGAFQLRNTADYLVASQVNVPLPGWPYDVVLERLRDHDMTPEDVGSLIVRRFVRFYKEESVTMTMLDLKRGLAVGRAVADLANTLATCVTDYPSEVDRIDEMFRQCHVTEGQLAIDLTTFCWNLTNYAGHDAVRRAAVTLGNLLINPTKPFVREHGRSNLSVALLHGVSIFAPNVDAARNLPELRRRYDALDLTERSEWGDLVFALAVPG